MAGKILTERDRFLLWVDDDQALLNHAVARLQDNGIRVQVTPTVDQALEVIRTQKHNLIGVLVDMMMDPGQALKAYDHKSGFETGFRFIDYLYENDLIDGLKICIFTNHTPPRNFYSPEGTDIQIRIDRKSRYKAVQFVQYVQKRFLDGAGGD